MRETPKEVQDTFDALKQELGKKLSLHKINNHYYVYEYETVRDNVRRKTIVKTYYIGHITNEGKYLSKEQRQLASLESKNKTQQTFGNEEYDKREEIAIRNLSMNGRMSMNLLSKRIGMSVTGTRHFVKRLEAKYKIRYFADINTFNLGYHTYVVLAKFLEQKPSPSELKAEFENNPNVILIAETKGEFNLIIIFYMKKDESLSKFFYELRSQTILRNYSAEMYLSITFTSESSVIMPRNPFLEMVKQSAEKNKINKWFGKLECKVMNELVKNGNEEFRNIDRKLGLESGHTNYIFYKLKTKGIINRTTITIKPIGFKFNGIFIMKINNYKLFSESRQKWLLELISKRGIINKYLFAEDIGIPDGVLHITPIFNEHDIASTDNILSNISGSRTESLVVTNIILGEFCYRNFDPTYTNIYDILTKNYGLKLGQKEKYE